MAPRTHGGPEAPRASLIPYESAPPTSGYDRSDTDSTETPPNTSSDEERAKDLRDVEKGPLDLNYNSDYKFRTGRRSMVQQPPGTTFSQSMSKYKFDMFNLTHAIDALEVEVDEITELRNKVVRIKPVEDPGRESVKATLSSLATLLGKFESSFVALEGSLVTVFRARKGFKDMVKSRKADFTVQELNDIKYELAQIRVDFNDLVERIREGAFKEQTVRLRLRAKMGLHFRARQPEISDKEVHALVDAAELGAAKPGSKVTTYAGLWRLSNPFTELAEFTTGSPFVEGGPLSAHDPRPWLQPLYVRPSLTPAAQAKQVADTKKHARLAVAPARSKVLRKAAEQHDKLIRSIERKKVAVGMLIYLLCVMVLLLAMKLAAYRRRIEYGGS